MVRLTEKEVDGFIKHAKFVKNYEKKKKIGGKEFEDFIEKEINKIVKKFEKTKKGKDKK